MLYVFDKTKNQVTITADNRNYEVDVEEIIRVNGIVDIANVELITDPLDNWSHAAKLRIYTTPDGVTDLKYMVMCKTFTPWKKKTEKKD